MPNTTQMSINKKPSKPIKILFYFILFYLTLPYIKGGYFASMIKIIFPLKIFSLTQLGQKECDGSLFPKVSKKKIVCLERRVARTTNTTLNDFFELKDYL